MDKSYKHNKLNSNGLKVRILAAAISSALISTWANAAAIEEVVVTAQKRAQNMQDIPVSISALNARDMEEMKLSTGSDIAAFIPNLSVNLPYGEGSAPYFSLRGVTTYDYSHNQSSPNAMYVDEVYKSVGALQATQIYDLDRIEVLRGPQGTLYGRNATGGAVNFITVKPDFEKEAYLTLGVGNYSRVDAKGAVQIPLVDDVLAARVAFTYAQADGTLENEFAGGKDQSELDQWAVRGGLLYTPSDSLDIMLRYSASEAKGENYGPLAKNIQDWVPADRVGLDYHENESNATPKKRSIENTAVSLTINWDVNDHLMLTSISAYDDGEWHSPADDDGLPVDVAITSYNSSVDQWSQEIRLTSSNDGPFNWIVGAYWGEDDVDMRQRLDLLGFFPDAAGLSEFGLDTYGFNERNSFTQERENKAVYLHTTYELTDSLTLVAGLRYTEDELKVTQLNADFGAFDTVTDDPIWFRTIDNLGISDSSENTSGKIGLDWRAADDVLVYASFSTGYRGPAVNGQAFLDPSELTTADPEELEAWELGVKSQFFDNRVQLNAALFYYDYTDQHIIQFGTAGIIRLENAEEATLQGGEIELVFQASDTLQLKAGAGYLDGEYDKLLFTIPDDELGEVAVDLSGNSMIATPEFSFSGALEWDFLVVDSGTFSLHLDTSFTDEQFFDAFNSERLVTDGYWVSNGRIAFHDSSDRYSVGAWIKNIGDEEYETYAADLSSIGYDYFSRGMPQTFGADVTFNF